ncbi:MAG: hypothetical protein ACYDBJ_04460 [Aggregatilineales bacterium]
MATLDSLIRPVIAETDMPANLVPRRLRRKRIIVLGIGLLVLVLIGGVVLAVTMGFTCG